MRAVEQDSAEGQRNRRLAPGHIRVYTRYMSGICYCAALRAATRKVSARYDAALAPLGINIAQFSLLRHIERAAPVSLTELGRKVGLDRSTIGRNVRVLQRLGLVRVTPGVDQREATVALAEPGRDVLRRGAPLWEEVQHRIEAGLGPDGARQLRRLLRSF
jgi:DNA-binding MarR family transcriptional regulator